MQITHFKSDTLADATGTVTGWYGTSTVTVAATDMVRPSDWNSQHALAFTLAGNTTVGSTVSGSVVPFAGMGGVSVGVSNSSLVISGPAAGGSITLNNWNIFQLNNNTSFSSLGQNSIYFQHFIPPQRVEFSQIELWARGSFASSSNSQVYQHTIQYGLYSQGAGASTSQMTLMSSSSQVVSASFNSNTAYGFTLSGGGTSFTTTSGGTAVVTNISGPFHHYMPFSGTLQPNQKYAVAFVISSATTVNTAPWRYAPLVQTVMNSLSMGRLFSTGSQAAATSVIGDREMGVYTAASAALPNSYATSNISIAVSRQILPIQFEA